AYDIAKRLLEKCRKGDRRATQTIVDVTGGTRSIQVGVLLACLGRNQDIQLIGSPYDAAGDPITTDSFPIIVHFEPEIRWRAELFFRSLSTMGRAIAGSTSPPKPAV